MDREEFLSKNRRENAIRRVRYLVYTFADLMLEEERKGIQEQEAARKMKENAGKDSEITCMISCWRNNVRCMHDCMKAAADAARYLADNESDVEDWQIAGINAMLDQCRENGVVPYNLPYAIKGLLLIPLDEENDQAGLMVEAVYHDV